MRLHVTSGRGSANPKVIMHRSIIKQQSFKSRQSRILIWLDRCYHGLGTPHMILLCSEPRIDMAFDNVVLRSCAFSICISSTPSTL